MTFLELATPLTAEPVLVLGVRCNAEGVTGCAAADFTGVVKEEDEAEAAVLVRTGVLDADCAAAALSLCAACFAFSFASRSAFSSLSFFSLSSLSAFSFSSLSFFLRRSFSAFSSRSLAIRARSSLAFLSFSSFSWYVLWICLEFYVDVNEFCRGSSCAARYCHR